jgi:hypothetical protein
VHITGVQPVGGARYVAMQAVVVDDRPPPPATATETGPGAQHAARLIAAQAETVVFPRRGGGIDKRPDELKRAKAAARYRDHCRDTERDPDDGQRSV